MHADDVRALAASAPGRWAEIAMTHHSHQHAFEVTLRPGELRGRDLRTGRTFEDRERPPSCHFRPVEPYPTNYHWCAMLDPVELSHDVTISQVEETEPHRRPAVTFVAHAEEGNDPICGCCPLQYSDVSERHEQPEGCTPAPGQFPDGVELALDLELGIVVRSRDRGGRLGGWLSNDISEGRQAP
jgi:hypothetical protein